MAAGQGFKTFVTGEVLTSGDVNGYLMQGINVFTNATARDAAITAPAEGQFAFTKDNNSLWYYDGAAWVASGATGDIEGVTAGVGISGGGTSGTVTITNSMATAITAKGDLVVGTGSGTFQREAVGANGTVLTADSAQADGVRWATPASGSMTLLSTTTLSGASTTVSSISGAYKDLLIHVSGMRVAAQSYAVYFNPNGSASITSGATVKSLAAVASTEGYNGNTLWVNQAGDYAGNNLLNAFTIRVFNYATSEPVKNFSAIMQYVNGSGNTQTQNTAGGIQTTSAITSWVTATDQSTFNAGTIKIYGVN